MTQMGDLLACDFLDAKLHADIVIWVNISVWGEHAFTRSGEEINVWWTHWWANCDSVWQTLNGILTVRKNFSLIWTLNHSTHILWFTDCWFMIFTAWNYVHLCLFFIYLYWPSILHSYTFIPLTFIDCASCYVVHEGSADWVTYSEL